MERITIEVGGTPRPFHFGVGFIGRMLDALDTDLKGFQTAVAKNPFKVVPMMMLESHKLAAYLDDAEPALTKVDILKFMDADGGIPGPNVQKFLNAFSESQNRDTPPPKKARPKTAKRPKTN